ncbi:hypothetical protein ACLOJK_034431, partial [Asimina triloba]
IHVGGSERLWVVGPRGGVGAIPVPATRHRRPSGRRTDGGVLHNYSNSSKNY